MGSLFLVLIIPPKIIKGIGVEIGLKLYQMLEVWIALSFPSFLHCLTKLSEKLCTIFGSHVSSTLRAKSNKKIITNRTLAVLKFFFFLECFSICFSSSTEVNPAKDSRNTKTHLGTGIAEGAPWPKEERQKNVFTAFLFPLFKAVYEYLMHYVWLSGSFDISYPRPPFI